MKILVLTTKSNWGGAQKYVYDLATELQKDTCEVEVMAGGNGVLIEKLRAAGIPADGNLPIGRDVSFGEDLMAFFRLFRIIRAKRPDILHLNSSKIGAMGALAGRLAGVPKIIFTAHGWAFNENRSLASKFTLKCIYWITLLLSHRTIAVSEAVKSDMENWPFVMKKISVIYNGIVPAVGFSRISARHELARLHEGLRGKLASTDPKNIFWIGTVAELHHIKGHRYAIRGIYELLQTLKSRESSKEVIYTIIGTGEEKEGLEKLVKDLGLQNTVFFLGHIDQASTYMKAFDTFLLASLSEGLGFVLLEAGLAQIPAVATAVGGIPEIIEDMKSGILIQPKKPAEICHALEFLIEHKNVQKEYRENLHKKVVETFSVDKMIQSTIRLYHATG